MARRLTPLEGHTLAALEFDKETAAWVFSFSSGDALRVDAAWRMRTADRILIGWRDDGEWFGRQAPVEAPAEVLAAVGLALVIQSSAEETSGDLLVRFENGTSLEVFNDSCGYEGWQLSHAAGDTLARGGGGLVDV